MDAPGQVDVKGIGMKQEINRKMTSKKKSWEAKSESFYVISSINIGINKPLWRKVCV